MLGILRTVLFAPEDLALVRGDPTERRRFLDDLLVVRRPRLAGVRADYDRVLRQRNALLKSARAAPARQRGDLRTLDVWDGHLAGTAPRCWPRRLRAGRGPRARHVAGLRRGRRGGADRASCYRCSLEGETARGSPTTCEPSCSTRAAASDRRARQEIERGVCLVGPHRDDLRLRLGAVPAKGFASHGESWSLALALRLASYELLQRPTGGEPVLILDDVFAELDARRRARLAGWPPAPSRCWSPRPSPTTCRPGSPEPALR